jgi:tetratricopeptide (TPR) repeat protein
MNASQEPEYYYRYSQSLKAVGNYAKADKMLEQFIANQPQTSVENFCESARLLE